jgi:hypothetical protein
MFFGVNNIDIMDEFIEKPSVLLFVGKPGKGKSNAIKWFILKHSVDIKMYNFGIVFARTKFNEDYYYIDNRFVYGNYDQNILTQYLNNLQMYRMKNKKPPARNFVIFDDLIGLLGKNDPFLINFFGTHRHTNTDVYLATQHLNTGG